MELVVRANRLTIANFTTIKKTEACSKSVGVGVYGLVRIMYRETIVNMFCRSCNFFLSFVVYFPGETASFAMDDFSLILPNSPSDFFMRLYPKIPSELQTVY